MKQAQIIAKDGKPEWAVVPYSEYQRLLEAAEAAEELTLYREAKTRRREEEIPSEVVYRILDGEHPVAVWREHRGMTQEQLAKAAHLSAPYISQIEARKRVGTLKSLVALAHSLNVSLEMLGGSGQKPRRKTRNS